MRAGEGRKKFMCSAGHLTPEEMQLPTGQDQVQTPPVRYTHTHTHTHTLLPPSHPILTPVTGNPLISVSMSLLLLNISSE